MKMIYITANISVLEQILSLLEQHNISSYQIVERASAKPIKGDKRMDNAVWPGYNAIIFAQLDDNKCEKLKQELKTMNQSAHNDNELVMCADWSINLQI